MPSDLDDLRAAFVHQISLFGPIIPGGEIVVEEYQREPIHIETVPEVTTENPPVETESRKRAESDAPLAVDVEKETPESEPVLSAYDRIAALIPRGSPMLDMTTLEELSEYVAQTELIELDKTRLNPVFGVGNPEADLLVIGEAPGADEDEKGEPFVGRAGKLLTKILQSIGFEREDVYIANILKSRPPNNRKPEPAEVQAHLPILHKQITLIRPKLVLCVGKTAGTSLLGLQSTLGEMRGTFHDYHGLPVLVTYHPAALLRNGNWKRPTWEDVQLLRARYDELTA